MFNTTDFLSNWIPSKTQAGNADTNIPKYTKTQYNTIQQKTHKSLINSAVLRMWGEMNRQTEASTDVNHFPVHINFQPQNVLGLLYRTFFSPQISLI